MVVYFVQRESDGAIKIGFSGCFEYRLNNLKSTTGEKFKILGIIEGDREIEKEMHLKFGNSRILGEWFKPSDSLLSYIISRKGDFLNLADLPKTRKRDFGISATVLSMP